MGDLGWETVSRMMARSGTADRRACRFYPIAESHQKWLTAGQLCLFSAVGKGHDRISFGFAFLFLWLVVAFLRSGPRS